MSRERSLSWASPAFGAIRPIGSWWATELLPQLTLICPSRGPVTRRQSCLGVAKALAAAPSRTYKHREPKPFADFLEDFHAPKPPCAGRTARRVIGTRRRQICRGFLHGQIRRHPCAGDGHPGGAVAAMAQGP